MDFFGYMLGNLGKKKKVIRDVVILLARDSLPRLVRKLA